MDAAETNREFAESLDLDYPILSDPQKKTARAYGVLRAGLFASRHTITIGKDGTVLDIDTDVQAKTAGPDLIAKLEALGIPRRAVGRV